MAENLYQSVMVIVIIASFSKFLAINVYYDYQTVWERKAWT